MCGLVKRWRVSGVEGAVARQPAQKNKKKTPNTKHQTPEKGGQTRNTKYRIRFAKFEIPDFIFQMANSGSRISSIKSETPGN
jgi:hypothetical protein